MWREMRKTFIAALAMAGSALLLAPGSAQAVPSFARQTGMACQACHTVFPELTPFGRRFKLNAYTIDNLPQVTGISTSKDQTLLLNQLPPLSFMLQASYTSTKKAIPDSAVPGELAQNGQVQFPQQASLFYAGRIAPNFGAFVQMTYDGSSGTFGWDNTDIRYAGMANDKFLWGISFNNNPTVQDVWNTTNAWQSPFDQRSATAPTPAAATLLGGGASDMAGLSVYGFWNDSIYAELGFYRSAPAVGAPLDSTSTNVLKGYAPYWRVAYERQWTRNSWQVGAHGMDAKMFPGGGVALSGPTNRFNDWAIDSQYQYIGDEHLFSVLGAYIEEKQTWDAGGAANPTNDLKTLRIGASYYYHRRYGAALGHFSTTGSEDAVLYAPLGNAVTDFANNKPNSDGWVTELDWVPYENTKFALQYTMYNKFNGGDTNYDGQGRNAKDNNTLYLLAWLNF
jgi:hypothetical protein